MSSIPRRARSALAPILVVALASSPAAQTNAPPSSRVPIPIDTGYAANSGLEPETVLAFPVSEPGAAWLRLYFAEIELSGSLARGTGSFLRITSLADGAMQRLDALSAEQCRARARTSTATRSGSS